MGWRRWFQGAPSRETMQVLAAIHELDARLRRVESKLHALAEGLHVKLETTRTYYGPRPPTGE